MKFNSKHDEYLWEGAVASGVVTGSGEVDSPTGWFAPVTLVPSWDKTESAAIEHYGTRFLVLHESNEGFVTVIPFDDEAARNQRIEELEIAYSLWKNGITPEQAREAIDGYLQAALHAAKLDADELAWSVEAQQRVIREVQLFITQNAEDIKEWQEESGHSWLQVGIDFEFSRNQRVMGFATRAESEAGQMLELAAEAWGPAPVSVGPKGEVDFT